MALASMLLPCIPRDDFNCLTTRQGKNAVVTEERKMKCFAVLLLSTGFLVLTTPIWAFLWLNADWVPTSVTFRLPGASDAEVRELLGNPDNESDFQWVFRRPTRFAEFQVRFSK